MRKEKTGDCIKGDRVGVRDNGEDKWNGEDEKKVRCAWKQKGLGQIGSEDGRTDGGMDDRGGETGRTGKTKERTRKL